MSLVVSVNGAPNQRLLVRAQRTRRVAREARGAHDEARSRIATSLAGDWMKTGVLESDWKLFRELRDVALERCCERILEEVGTKARQDGLTAHERFLAVYRIVRDRDRVLGSIFDGLSRSRMLEQLAAMRFHALVTPGELEAFSHEVREYLGRIAALNERPE